MIYDRALNKSEILEIYKSQNGTVPTAVCGDGICEGDEPITCPEDCERCHTEIKVKANMRELEVSHDFSRLIIFGKVENLGDYTAGNVGSNYIIPQMITGGAQK